MDTTSFLFLVSPSVYLNTLTATGTVVEFGHVLCTCLRRYNDNYIDYV